MRSPAMFLLVASALYLSFLCVTPEAASTANQDDVRSLEVLSRVRRVIGGQEIEEGEWPYLVHMVGKIPTKLGWFNIPLSYTNFYCGGSVLNKRWILTAAHCFKMTTHSRKVKDRIMTPKYWHAKVGEVEAEHSIFKGFLGRWHRFFGNKDQGMWYLHAEKIVLHPEYNEYADWKNDLALVKLEDDLPVGPGENPNIGTVKLPTRVTDSAWPAPGTYCVMKGWGCSEHGQPLADTARAANMTALADTVCRSIYRGSDWETRVCAGEVDGNVGICKGDSGGPLVCDWQGDMVQAGVASFTSAIRPGKVPGAFTDIRQYMRWIQDTIRT